MRAKFAWAVMVLCLWVFDAVGQEPMQPLPPVDEWVIVEGIDSGETFAVDMPARPSPRFFAEIDYVAYWLKPVCLKPPTLSIGDPNGAMPGVLGQPGSVLIQGGHKFEFKGANGIKPRLAWWLNDDVGTEVEGFVLERVAAPQDVTTVNGSPPTYIVFQNPDNTDAALPFTIPGVVTGTSTATGSSRMWGIDSNLAVRWPGQPGGRLQATLLAGCRYLHLEDRVVITNRQALVADPSQFAVGQANFSTRSQFIGGQLGSRFGIAWERVNFDITTKLAFGSVYLTSDVLGSPLLAGNSVLPPLVPGPVLALPSNTRSRSTSRVAVVPELNLKLRWQVTERAFVTLGYNLLYWNKVLCPGDQMDSHLNTTQLPGQGPVVGPRVPAPLLVFTDAFAHGLETGFGFNF
ncbi:MAG: BBP7 family outer membrane beta-barrel protein [Gemmataceae bacterium]